MSIGKEIVSRRKKVVVEVRRDLNRLRFSPTAVLVNQVFPQLDPKEQARVCLELLSYIWAKPVSSAKQQRSQKVTINNQIANQPTTLKQETGLTSQQLALLEQIASGSSEDVS